MQSSRRKNISSFFLITSTLVFLVTSSPENNGTSPSSSSSAQTQISRQTLEIIIGTGSPPPAYPPDDGGCPDCMPTPEPPACPPPPSPRPRPTPTPTPPSALSANLRQAIKVIQRLKKRINRTPITDTWTGDKICYDKSKYKGFFCYQRGKESKFRIGGVKFNVLGFNYQKGPLDVNDFIDTVSEDLVFFHINSNNFSGDIPSEILKIPRFYELDLSNNKFTGPFPKPILSANLTILDLRFNKFSGPLPSKVFELDLDVLFLNNNEFSGNIPQNLGKLPVLYLSLARNKFTGSIPNSIGEASRNLLEILLLDNQLSGCLPYEIGLLKKTRLFDASFNQLTGPIPHSFGCLEKLNIMNISNNQLYGEVPESLCKLGDLEKLQFKFNYLTQVGPECRKLINKGVLDVNMNCIFDLPVQRTRKECQDFFSKSYVCSDAQRLTTQLPCKIPDQIPRSGEETPRRTKEAMAPSPSYAALNNRRALLSMQ